MADLWRIGRYGEPLPNLRDTVLAGARVLGEGKVERWWGDHEADPNQAIDRFVRHHGGIIL